MRFLGLCIMAGLVGAAIVIGQAAGPAGSAAIIGSVFGVAFAIPVSLALALVARHYIERPQPPPPVNYHDYRRVVIVQRVDSSPDLIEDAPGTAVTVSGAAEA